MAGKKGKNVALVALPLQLNYTKEVKGKGGLRTNHYYHPLSLETFKTWYKFTPVIRIKDKEEVDPLSPFEGSQEIPAVKNFLDPADYFCALDTILTSMASYYKEQLTKLLETPQEQRIAASGSKASAMETIRTKAVKDALGAVCPKITDLLALQTKLFTEGKVKEGLAISADIQNLLASASL
jgi:hypothetical protein